MKNVAECVVPERLISLLERLAAFGAREAGGIDRQAFSDADLEGRSFLVHRARALGCEVFQDPAGNLFARRPGTSDLPPVVTGSHVDTQPIGGKLDGAYGVCAGLEVIAAMNDGALSTRHPVEVAIWANEEGCRFAPGCTGSAAFVEPSRLGRFVDIVDTRGQRYGDCLAAARRALADVPERGLALPFACFVELHIEQGPVLEGARVPIGIVEGVQGVRWLKVTSRGRAAHAGTTPLQHRKDALRPLSELMQLLYAQAEADLDLRLTVGVVQVRPGSINTIPEEAMMTIDARHAQREALARCEKLLHDYCMGPRHGCLLSIERTMEAQTTRFDPSIAHALAHAARSLGLASMQVMSGAFHDAVHLAPHCPTGMIFVPSRGGISHSSQEHTDAAELVAGARVLAMALVHQAGVQ